MGFKEVVTIETSKYPKEDFVGLLEAYYIKYVEQLDAKVLTLEFENPEDTESPQEITIFGIDYLDRENEAGQITTGKSFGLGLFLDSLKAIGSKFLYDTEANEVQFEPDLRGKTLDMDANSSTKISDEGEKTRQNWKIRNIVDSATPITTPAPTHTKTPVDSLGDIRGDWEDLITSDEFYTAPHSHPEILRHLRETLPSAKERTRYTKAFKATFSALVEDGVLMMPEEGKYQYVV